ncbi:MAG TPA: hypothetical protein VMR37_04510 [Rhabdochlamydiaceae bacterium]|nr:hypothetical protein [Rhabdochlamydiaceae bacterium]
MATVNQVLRIEPRESEPLLQMSEMDEVGNVAPPAITAANQHLMIKGITGRYGIIDSLVFAFYSITSRFTVLNHDTAKQLDFYRYFNALKRALTTSDRPKIKESYDNLVRTVRSYTTSNFDEQNRLDAALLTILNEELSEKTTNGFLHEIRLLEGLKIAAHLSVFIQAPNVDIQGAVFANYGTPEQVRDDFCHVAAHAAQDEAEVGQFIASRETKIRRFNSENFADAGETNRILSRLCEYLGNHMISNEPITATVLEGIEEGGIYLVRGLRNLGELAARLEQVRLQYAGPRQERSRKIGLYQEVLRLGRELEVIEGDIFEKRDELSKERMYTSSDVAAFVGEGIDMNVVLADLARDKEQFVELLKELKAVRKSLNQAIETEHLPKTLPKLQQVLQKKEKDFEDFNDTHRPLLAELQQLRTLYDNREDEKQRMSALSNELSFFKRLFLRMFLWAQDVEVRKFRDDLQLKYPKIVINDVFDDFYIMPGKIAHLRAQVEMARSFDTEAGRALIAKIPELEVSVIVIRNQLRELAFRIATGLLLRHIPRPKGFEVSDAVLLALRPSEDISQDNPLAGARVAAQAKDGEYKRAQQDFNIKRREYETAYAAYLDMYRNSPELPKVEERVRPLNVNESGLVADPSIQEFSAEIVQNVSRQTAQMLKAQAKEKYLQSLDIARRICKIKGDEEAKVFQETVRSMNPRLRQAFSYEIGSARPNRHQDQMVFCDYLTAQLATN